MVFAIRELQRVVPLPGAQPCNVARFGGYRGKLTDHLAIASLNGMILILDGSDRVVSVVGGQPPVYLDGKLQPLEVFNYTFNHPHDVYAVMLPASHGTCHNGGPIKATRSSWNCWPGIPIRVSGAQSLG